MEEKKKLTVPTKINLEWEVWPGFGKREIVYSATISGVILAFLLIGVVLKIWDLPVVVVSMIIVLSFCSSIFTKLDNNQSVYGILRNKTKYLKEQQKFIYNKKNEEVWMNEETNG